MALAKFLEEFEARLGEFASEKEDFVLIEVSWSEPFLERRSLTTSPSHQSFCSGEEITDTVMSTGDYEVSLHEPSAFQPPRLSFRSESQLVGKKTSHWALSIVTRFGHANGVAP